jgi:hypothetical protein
MMVITAVIQPSALKEVNGKIFVWPVESAVRIQTGETGDGHADATLTLLNFNDFRVFQLASNR